MNSWALQIRIQAQPGKSERVREEILRLAAPTRTEASCLSYALHHSVETEGLYLLSASWINRQALEEYLQSPGLEEFRGRLKDLLAHPPEISLWEKNR